MASHIHIVAKTKSIRWGDRQMDGETDRQAGCYTQFTAVTNHTTTVILRGHQHSKTRQPGHAMAEL